MNGARWLAVVVTVAAVLAQAGCGATSRPLPTTVIVATVAPTAPAPTATKVPATPSPTSSGVATPTLVPAATIPLTMTLRVYFNTTSGDCHQVQPAERTVPRTQAVATAALQELFAGPTSEEAARGFSSVFSERTKGILKRVTIKDGVAYVDLRDIRQLLGNASTSCGSANFLAETRATLTQFSTIEKVIFAIEGQPAAFYEWMQIGCGPETDSCDETPFR